MSPAGRANGDPVVGIVGGGQLARMLYQAAIPLGVDVRILTDTPHDGVARVARDVEVADRHDADALRRFARTCDVLTFDHEHVDPHLLAELEADGVVVRPGARAMAVATDKLAQRALFAELGLPVAPYTPAADLGEVARTWRDRGEPVVVKTARGGYDGRGVWVVTDGDDLAELRAADPPGPFVVEPLLDLELELATLVARGADGTTVHYPVVRTHQEDGMCRSVEAPAAIPDGMAAAAGAIACLAADALDLVGILAVELFVVDGRPLLNELAPRTHNSGHYTIEACATSQFENHLRAVLGLPLGPADLVVPACAMANLVGRAPGLEELASYPAHATVHRYGKADRPGRKVGHVTVCGDDPAEVLALAEHLADAAHRPAAPPAPTGHPAERPTEVAHAPGAARTSDPGPRPGGSGRRDDPPSATMPDRQLVTGGVGR